MPICGSMRWWCLLATWTALAQTATPPPGAAAASPSTALPSTPSAAELMRASIDRQRLSIAAQQSAIRKQAENAGAKLLPWTASPTLEGPEPACDPIAPEIVNPLIESSSKAAQLEVKLVRAVIEQESGFHACALSRKGAQGLMQIMPETAADWNVKDPFDPQENIATGTKYLKQLLDKYKGDTRLALAAYNAGPATVDAAKGVPDIAETREYVDAILKKIK